jgi:hypothetical protein
MKIKFPEKHLLKITYLGEFMIITSIVECVDEDGKPTVPYGWYDMQNLPSGDYVPGIKELIPKAFEMHIL